MYTWRDREVVMDILALLTGNRVNYGMNTIGGVSRDITAEQVQQMLKAIDTLEERTKYYIQVATEEITLIRAAFRRRHALARRCGPAGRGRPDGPRFRRGQGHPPRRPLCRLRRTFLQGHHG